MPITKTYRILSCDKEIRNKKMTVMTYISEEEEELLDKGKSLTLIRGDRTFKIEYNTIYCYGKVDFTTGSDDMETIEDIQSLNHLSKYKPMPIYADYNYENHECRSPLKRCRWTETFHPSIVAQYAHGCLGKPERIIIFYMFV